MTAPSVTRPTLVFDVLGTLVDQAGSLASRVRDVTGRSVDASRDLVHQWLAEVARHEAAIDRRDSPFRPSHDIDRSVLAEMTAEGRLRSDDADALADASTPLSPWDDSVRELDRLAEIATVIGLSNASRRTLAALSTNVGFRWHQVFSAEEAGAYKPSPEIYRVALAGSPAGPIPIMVAAHAWDLRAAAAVGMRTAYVPRPGGDPPAPGDRFDCAVSSLAELRAAIAA